jgi:hypothetical protein
LPKDKTNTWRFSGISGGSDELLICEIVNI